MKKIAVNLLGYYKKHLSPNLEKIFGKACRYSPTCSEYSIEAFNKYGFWKGLGLSLKRVVSCNPWGGSGFDPVK